MKRFVYKYLKRLFSYKPNTGNKPNDGQMDPQTRVPSYSRLLLSDKNAQIIDILINHEYILQDFTDITFKKEQK